MTREGQMKRKNKLKVVITQSKPGELLASTRDTILKLYKRKISYKKIAKALYINEITVKEVIDEYKKHPEIRLPSKISKPNVKRTEPQKKIKGHNYENSSEYTLHFKGAEFEDTRPRELRNLGANHPVRYRF